MPLFIFTASEQADPHIQEQAWGTALVLIAFVLIASTMAREHRAAKPAEARRNASEETE